jgi:hypothetical protein
MDSELGTNVQTFLGTPSSANLIAAVTDETGTGDLVFATSPTLVTPVLGTPASGNLSNCTAYEGTAVLSTGETGGTKYLREDGDGTCSWQTPAGSGTVDTSGTPETNDFARFTDADTIEGRSYSEVRGDLGVLPSIDEDTMSSDSDAYVPTQQSVKAYVDAVKQSFTKMIYIEDPEATDDYPVMKVPFACTITRITHITDTGTVDWNLEERAEATPDVAGTDVYSADEQSSSTSSTDTSFNNATLAQYTWLTYCASAVASSPTKLWVGITFTED